MPSLGEIVVALLNALASLPKIADMLNSVIQTVIGWYVSRQQRDSLAAIADAAAFAARAQTDEDRYAAAQKWRDALSRARVTQ